MEITATHFPKMIEKYSTITKDHVDKMGSFFLHINFVSNDYWKVLNNKNYFLKIIIFMEDLYFGNHFGDFSLISLMYIRNTCKTQNLWMF